MNHHIELIERHTSFTGEQRIYRDIAEPLVREIELAVYVPLAALSDKKRCKVLYYLPGLQTNARLVASQSDYQRYANRYDTILVIPDIFNIYQGDDIARVRQFAAEQSRISDYILRHLPAVIEHHFAVYDKCSVMGYGFGATLAMYLALQYPERFRSVSAFAPWLGFYDTPWYLRHLADCGLPSEFDPLQWYEQHSDSAAPPLWIDQGLADDHLGRQIQLDVFEQVIRQRPDCEDIWINRHERYDHSFYFVHSHICEHFVFHNEHYPEV